MPKTRLFLLLIVILAGFIVVALSDSGPRIFSLSEDHGPSLQDAVGLILILGPYLYLVFVAWKRRSKIRKYQNLKVFKLSLFLLGLGVGLIIASVMNDYQYWWIHGAWLLLIIQIPILYITLK